MRNMKNNYIKKAISAVSRLPGMFYLRCWGRKKLFYKLHKFHLLALQKAEETRPDSTEAVFVCCF